LKEVIASAEKEVQLQLSFVAKWNIQAKEARMVMHYNNVGQL
jgi:hypothetical protein